jgi:putative transposase
VVRAIHTVFAREYRKKSGFQERIWQRRFYDHVIRNKEDWLTKLAYMHNNPVTAGLVENILDYPWSSSRFWETGTGPVECDGWE